MMSITQSLEDYLEAIYVLESKGTPATVRGVARFLDVKMPSVVAAVRLLKDRVLARQEPYAPITLTAEGRAAAKKILARHTLLKRFLIMLGVKPGTADEDACRMEHILSHETMEKIRLYTEGREGK